MPDGFQRDVLKADFDRDGYALARGVFDPGECAVMRAFIRSLLPSGWDAARPETWRGRARDCCTNLPLYARHGLLRYKDRKGFADAAPASTVYANERMMRLASSLAARPIERMRLRGLHPVFPIGGHISLDDWFGGRLSNAGWPRMLAELRFPRPPQAPIFGHLEVHMLDLGAMAYFSDTDENGGAFAVWPGSHAVFADAFESRESFLARPAYHRLQKAFSRRAPRKIAAAAGDVVFFHPRLMHSNTVNYSRRIRYAGVLDFYAEGWRRRDEVDPICAAERARGDALDATWDIGSHSAVRAVLDRSPPCLLRALFVDHPRVHQLVDSISKDHSSDGRAEISRLSRLRRAGDRWLVVGQAAEYRDSIKLDTYGEAAAGDYAATIAGEPIASTCGIIVREVDPRALAAGVVVEGRFGVDHFVRLIRTGNPVRDSRVLFNGRICAGATRFETGPIAD